MNIPAWYGRDELWGKIDLRFMWLSSLNLHNYLYVFIDQTYLLPDTIYLGIASSKMYPFR